MECVNTCITDLQLSRFMRLLYICPALHWNPFVLQYSSNIPCFCSVAWTKARKSLGNLCGHEFKPQLFCFQMHGIKDRNCNRRHRLRRPECKTVCALNHWENISSASLQLLERRVILVWAQDQLCHCVLLLTRINELFMPFALLFLENSWADFIPVLTLAGSELYSTGEPWTRKWHLAQQSKPKD